MTNNHVAASSGISVVQSKTNSQLVPGSGIAITFDATPTAGNSIHVACNSGNPLGTATVSDNKSNTYNQIQTTGRMITFLATGISSSSTFTVTCNTTDGEAAIIATETTPLTAADDTDQIVEDAAVDSWACGSVTTTVANTVTIVSLSVSNSTATPGFIPPSGYTTNATIVGTASNHSLLSAYKVRSSTGTETPTATSTGLGFAFYTCTVDALK